MRGIIAVALAGLLSFGISQAWRHARAGDEAGALARLEAAVDAQAVRWVREGLPKSSWELTFVLAAPFSGDPLALPGTERRGGGWGLDSGVGAGGFLRALSREPMVVTWNLAAAPAPEDRRLTEPFERILLKAADAGARVRVIARGETAGLALQAAIDLRGPRGAPVIERITAVGVSREWFAARYPGLVEKAIADGALVEWDGLWSNLAEVSGDYHLDSWDAGAPRGESFERPWGDAAWPVVVMGVSRRGKAYAPVLPAVRTEPRAPSRARAAPAPGREAGASGLDMVVKESRPAESGKSSVGPREAAASSAIEDSGWTFTPPPGFAPWKNAASFGTAAGGHGNLVWGDGIFTVRVTYFSPGQHWAARYCQEDGKSASQTTHHGFPVEICADIPLRGEAPWRAGPSHCDLFVIQGDRYAIEALYQYPIGRREEKLALFMRAIEALRPAGK